jgi:hypothetical protein
MVERLIDQGTAEEYWKSGGILDRKSFDYAMLGLADIVEKPLSVDKSSLAQIEIMAVFSHILITSDQKYLYAFLRKMVGNPNERHDSQEGTVPVWDLSDEHLLAEVFLLKKDMMKRKSFMEAYPNIFNSS